MGNRKRHPLLHRRNTHFSATAQEAKQIRQNKRYSQYFLLSMSSNQRIVYEYSQVFDSVHRSMFFFRRVFFYLVKCPAHLKHTKPESGSHRHERDTIGLSKNLC
jgi:hypothetical protein